jgi:hypothetical protein
MGPKTVVAVVAVPEGHTRSQDPTPPKKRYGAPENTKNLPHRYLIRVLTIICTIGRKTAHGLCAA